MVAVRPLSLPPATPGRAKSGGRGLDLAIQAEQTDSRGPMVVQIENCWNFNQQFSIWLRYAPCHSRRIWQSGGRGLDLAIQAEQTDSRGPMVIQIENCWLKFHVLDESRSTSTHSASAAYSTMNFAAARKSVYN